MDGNISQDAVAGMQIGNDLEPIQIVPYPELRQLNFVYAENALSKVEVMTAINQRYPDNSVKPGAAAWSPIEIVALPAEVRAAIATIENYLTAILQFRDNPSS